MKRDFREALSYWASGVAVLAVSDGDEVEAITVSAFASVSVDPPLVLACVANQSAILPTLLDQRRFTVSLLAEDAQRAASAVAQRLPLDELRFAAEGDPVLEGAPVSLVCRLHAEHPGGDHRILVGEVERVELGRDAPPLLYFRRGYARLQGTRR
ncbi:MAG: flavin reductase [Gemmatimonadetes bacterium]|nr:flavin reductase [Gemmatimonadota bacterium]